MGRGAAELLPPGNWVLLLSWWGHLLGQSLEGVQAEHFPLRWALHRPYGPTSASEAPGGTSRSDRPGPKVSSVCTRSCPSLCPAQPPGAPVTHPHAERWGLPWRLMALAQEGKRPEVKGERRPQAPLPSPSPAWGPPPPNLSGKPVAHRKGQGFSETLPAPPRPLHPNNGMLLWTMTFCPLGSRARS